MKEVCRLGKRSIEVLLMYNEDANDAILLMQDTLMKTAILLEKERAVTKALQGVPQRGAAQETRPIQVSSGFISASAIKSGVPVPGIDEIVVRELLVDGMPESFWVRLKKELDVLVERARRGY